ncbi:hypothetical protein VPNG_02406 [Cytospora leucostoma]|uniref:F-box domain-containing protein n=1 Tax=Cytospora leucostoma TaxID=1230097 RepID=A0A423XGR8_9PEZI|nr:hypothetical protein VPNG_02406 [Cytospora leucostoma]
MASLDQSSISSAPTESSSSLAENVLSHGVPSPVSTCSAKSTATSIQKLPTELIFHIVDYVDSSDLHKLNLTCKAFHTAIQHQRWRHVRLDKSPGHLPNMIRNLISLAEKPESLHCFHHCGPEAPNQMSQTYGVSAAAVESSRPNPKELTSQFIQVLNFLGNKVNCPRLSHLTVDGSGLDVVQLGEIEKPSSTDINPIDIDSLRLISSNICNSTVPYGIINHCVNLLAVGVSHIPVEWRWNLKTVRKLQLFVHGDSTDLSKFDTGLDLPVLEWLYIDGCDEIFNYPVQAAMRERARYLSKVCPLLKRLAFTWCADGLRDPRMSRADPSDYTTRSTARYFFEEIPHLELVTFRMRLPKVVEIEKVGDELVQTERDTVKEPREDGWPDICP